MIFQSKSIGIDIQPDCVKIAVASGQGGRMRVLDLIEREIPQTSGQEAKAATASVIRQMFEESGLDGDTSVACLPASASINRTLATPITDPGKLRQTLKFQIEPQIPYPIEQVVSDYVAMRETDAGAELLAIAVTKNLISERLQLFEMAGVDPQVITLDALALADFYMNPFDFSPDKATALLHVDSSGSFLGFFSGEKLLGYRNLDGMSPGDEQAAKKMVKEIQRSLFSFQSSVSAEVGTLCIAGTGADNMRKILQGSLRDFPVRTVGFNEGTLAEIPPPLLDRADDFRLAIALARVGLGTSANEVNFRREEYAPLSPLSRVKSNIYFSLVVLAVALVAWFGSVAAEIRQESRQLESLNREMLKIFADTLPGINSPEVAEQRVKEEQDKFKSLRNYSSTYVSPLNVLSEVTASIPDKKNLALNDLAISDNVLRMTGEVDSFDDINIFNGRLEKSPLLYEVKIDSATKAEKGEKVNFRIRARIRNEFQSDAGARTGDNP